MNTALQALRFLSADETQRIAKIAGCEGRPTPDRWHVLLHDAQAESGFRDYVITDQQIVSRNLVSQFASAITQDQIIGQPVKVDSDRAALTARRLAAAAHVPVFALNYELRRDVLGGGPVWKVGCLDEQGREAGWVVIDATAGTVVARGGFSKNPGLSPTWAGEPVAVEQNAEDQESGTHPPQSTTAKKAAAARLPRSGGGGFHTPDAGAVTASADEQSDADGALARTNQSRPVERQTSRSHPTQMRRAEIDPVAEGRRLVTQPIRIVRGVLPF